MSQKKAKRFYKHTKRKSHEKAKRFLNTTLIVLMVLWYIVAFFLWTDGADNGDMPMKATENGFEVNYLGMMTMEFEAR